MDLARDLEFIYIGTIAHLDPINVVKPVILPFSSILFKMVVTFGVKVSLFHLLLHVKWGDLNFSVKLSSAIFLTCKLKTTSNYQLLRKKNTLTVRSVRH